MSFDGDMTGHDAEVERAIAVLLVLTGAKSITIIVNDGKAFNAFSGGKGLPDGYLEKANTGAQHGMRRALKNHL